MSVVSSGGSPSSSEEDGEEEEVGTATSEDDKQTTESVQSSVSDMVSLCVTILSHFTYKERNQPGSKCVTMLTSQFNRNINTHLYIRIN